MPMRGWAKVRAAAARHPRVMDILFAIPVVLLGWASGVGQEFGTVDWLWFTATHIPLVWRRRAPVIVFWVVAALTILGGEAGVDGAFQAVAFLFVLYAVARYRSWRHLVPIAVLILVIMAIGWVENGHTPEIISVGIVVTMVASLGVAVQARRAVQAERVARIEREREQRAELALAAERARIAREVHDIVAHNLAVMIALADGATAASAGSPQLAADAMRQVAETGRQALGETRRVLGVLRGGSAGNGLAPQPGVADIDELVRQVRAAGVRVTLTTSGTPSCGPGAGLTVYRIIQESLTNTLKHAGPLASAEVRVRYTEGGAELAITDDGAGRAATVPAGGPASGHGLTGMRERVASYGGQVEAGPLPGAGWRVLASLRFDDDRGGRP